MAALTCLPETGPVAKLVTEWYIEGNGVTNDAGTVHGRADHQGIEGTGVRAESEGHHPGDGDHGANILPLEEQVGGMEVSEAKRLKQLEEENRRLKGLVADLTLDNHILKEVLEKNV
ncbi:hypothetical protein SDC9_188731 [bioreactor metagenome]|uniref:Uncharacterized protein n=1 Tax=bioreactor metagenome TaxID=1076179 RepID=A0A645HSK1_9ZZZZ